MHHFSHQGYACASVLGDINFAVALQWHSSGPGDRHFACNPFRGGQGPKPRRELIHASISAPCGTDMHLFEIFHLRVECKEWDHQASSQSLAQQNELGTLLRHWSIGCKLASPSHSQSSPFRHQFMSESINLGESVREPWELLIEKTTIIDLCYLGQLWESKGGRIYSLHVCVMWKQEKKKDDSCTCWYGSAISTRDLLDTLVQGSIGTLYFSMTSV